MNLNFPHYTLGERIADGCIHVVGVTASLVAATSLIVFAVHFLPALSVVSIVVYCAGLVAVFSISAGYHLVTVPRVKAVLRKLDHAAIYMKIAATYTPFALVKMGGVEGYALLGTVWLLGICGAALKLLWPGQLARASYALYLTQGWICVAAFDPLTAAISSHVLNLLLLGGGLYTIGIVFHLWRQLPYHNAIWHAFVLSASACHFAAIVEAMTAAGTV